jgi:hypothetical protein
VRLNRETKDNNIRVRFYILSVGSVVAEWKKINDHETVTLWNMTAANGVTVQLCDGGK